MHIDQRADSILLFEEDLQVRTYLETALGCQGYSVEVVDSRDDLMARLERGEPKVAALVLGVTALRFESGGMDVVRNNYSSLPIIMVSSSAPHNSAQWRTIDAHNSLLEPIRPEDLRDALAAVLGKALPAERPASDDGPVPVNKQVFFGVAPGVRALQNLIGQIGWSDAPVLIQGETGSGKEIFARELHARSPRAKRAMLKLNCAALPSELVESELFGYERGAFTGAFQKKLGMFELADGGTIMLDEIGDMDIKLQAKLLQVLQDHQFQRLGGKEPISVDVRVIAATHRNLRKAITDGSFREDLYYRLNVVNLHVPPLRERREDIMALAEFFARKHTPPNMPPISFPFPLQSVMVGYDWPGNARQLENTVRKYLIIRDAAMIEQELRESAALESVILPPPPKPTIPITPVAPPPVPASERVYPLNGSRIEPPIEAEGDTPILVRVAKMKRDAEHAAILGALTKANWNRRQAALMLRTDYKSLLYRMKVLNIKKESASAPKTRDITADCA